MIPCWIALFCTLTIIWVPSATFAAERKMLAEVEINVPSDVLKLHQMGIDIASERARVPSLQVIITDRQLSSLRERGWKVTVLVENLRRKFEEEINADGDLGDYHTYEEMLQEMQLIAFLFPDITRLVDIGNGWEKAHDMADRDIWAMKISDNPELEEEAEADVLIVGCHHARELITVEIPLAIIRTLVSKYNRIPPITSLVDHREIWVVPMLNPDGHAYVEEVDPFWRKNRNTNGSADPFYQGVDLNRNYGFQWGYDNIGSSPNRWAEDYRGVAPLSEPEVQAIRDLVESHEFSLCLSFHSYGDLFLFPWGYINADTEDDPLFERLGQMYTRSNGYLYGNAKDGIIYNTNGDTGDWMYGEQVTKNKVFGVTVEVGHSFQPPGSSIPELISENLLPSLQMIYVAGWNRP
jgi:hypothetical protein